MAQGTSPFGRTFSSSPDRQEHHGSNCCSITSQPQLLRYDMPANAPRCEFALMWSQLSAPLVKINGLFSLLLKIEFYSSTLAFGLAGFFLLEQWKNHSKSLFLD